MRHNWVWSICLVALVFASVSAGDLGCVKYGEDQMIATCEAKKPLSVSAEFPDDKFGFTVGYAKGKKMDAGKKMNTTIETGDCNFTIKAVGTGESTVFYVYATDQDESKAAGNVTVKGDGKSLKFYRDDEFAAPLGPDMKCKPDFTVKNDKHLLKFSANFDDTDENLFIKLEGGTFVKEEVATTTGPGAEKPGNELIVPGIITGSCFAFILLLVASAALSVYVPAIRRRMPCFRDQDKKQADDVATEANKEDVPKKRLPKHRTGKKEKDVFRSGFKSD